MKELFSGKNHEKVMTWTKEVNKEKQGLLPVSVPGGWVDCYIKGRQEVPGSRLKLHIELRKNFRGRN